MNEITSNPSPIAKPKRTSKPAAPKTPRVLDPEIIALRKEHAARVNKYRGKKASADILATMLKRLVQLTPDDKLKLANALPAVTPALPMA